MKLFLTTYLSFTMLCSVAQQEIDPTSPEYSYELKPFAAEYLQMGNTLTLEAKYSKDSKIYNIAMSMPDLANPSRIITDVIGISSKDGSFIYRDFHLPMPSWTFNRAEFFDGKVLLESFNSKGSSIQEKESTKPLFDGTFVYWQLSGIDPSIQTFIINRWKQSPQGLVAGMTDAVLVLEGKEEVLIGEESFDCRIYSIEVAPGVKIINYVANEAPYLIKQDFKQGEGDSRPMLTLSKVLN